MKQAISILATANILGFSDVALARSTSPFVGEHKNSSVIEHGDGRISSKMKPVASAYNKYDKLLLKEGLFKDRVNYFDRINEALFGKKETKLERVIAEHEAKKQGLRPKKTKSSRHKLG